MNQNEICEREWYLHPSFNSYWRTYKRCMSWLKLNHVTPVVPHFEDGEEEDGFLVSPDARHLTQTKNHGTLASPVQLDEALYHDDHEEEVDQGYLDFIAVTLKHQQEREKEKERKRKSSSQITYVDITQVSSAYKTGQAPQTDDNTSSSNSSLRKKLQLLQWYGESSDQIAQIETNLQMEFDEYLEKYSPSFFPHCPINMSSFFQST